MPSISLSSITNAVGVSYNVLAIRLPLNEGHINRYSHSPVSIPYPMPAMNTSAASAFSVVSTPLARVVLHPVVRIATYAEEIG